MAGKTLVFTGIIEELGTVEAAGSRVRIRCAKVLSDAFEGASIAVNGVCLTAVHLAPDAFSAGLAPETLRRTNLGDLKPGSVVNLERPLAANGRLNGHIVQGHVDGTGELISLDALGEGNWWLKARVPAELDRYLVYKGSICIDGISLTVASIEAGILSVTIIPHTFERTNLRARRPGDRLNLECDILAKYLERMISKIDVKPGLTISKLREEGF